MLGRRSQGRRITLGADKAYDVVAFVDALRDHGVTPHIAVDGRVSKTGNRRATRIDRRTARWSACSALIDEACRTTGNMLSFAHGQSQDEAEIYLARLYTRGERHYALEREYFDVYYPRDEKIPRLFRLPDSEVVHVASLYTEDELKTSATYNGLLPICEYRNSVHARMDGPNGSRIAWFSVDPVDGNGLSFDQIEAIRALLPHLRQYTLVRQALCDARAQEMSLTGLLEMSGLAIVHLDGCGRIVMANERARKILGKGDALFDRAGNLHARLPADADALQAALARALPTLAEQGAGGSLLVGRPNRLPGLTVHINPVGAGEIDFRSWRIAALVLVIDQEATGIDPTLVAAALGLAAAESRVAVRLAARKRPSAGTYSKSSESVASLGRPTSCGRCCRSTAVPIPDPEFDI